MKKIILYIAALICIVPFIFLGCGGGSSGSDDDSGGDSGGGMAMGDADAAFHALEAALEGSWSGTWTNITFGSGGSISATVEISTSVGVVTIDVGGAVFGLLDPDPEMISSTLSSAGSTISLVAESAVAGPVMITITPNGSGGFDFTASGTSVPALAIASFTATGTQIGSTITGTSTPTFAGGGTASVSFTLTKS